jgi:hypothetical protein
VTPLLVLLMGTSSPVGAAGGPPLFVGPGVVVLEGGRGLHVWDRIEFGSRAATVTWELAAGSESCRVGVRVARRSGRTVDYDVAVMPAGERGLASSHLRVRYVSGKLAVRSSCPSWHLVMRGSRDDVGVSMEKVRYRVTGRTAYRIWTSMRNRSPWGWPAYTSWRWASDCGTVNVTVGLPHWIRPDGASDGLATKWRRFFRALRRHELGHVTFVRQAVARGEGCVQVSGWSAVQDRSDRYDRITDHGRTQGAYWSY